ncbi:hypothetical protein [uncultured Duncaniella sp.]|uniref:hypothetical protein n=1 Tax=uncultured Duncaniella sp. TaxID=2768039 RepID=UPI0025D8AE96|nr:hypothetical protein [uncultured Duncaniella sp.]
MASKSDVGFKIKAITSSFQIGGISGELVIIVRPSPVSFQIGVILPVGLHNDFQAHPGRLSSQSHPPGRFPANKNYA